jgi:soluble lytic murein transglycosylase-like protein
MLWLLLLLAPAPSQAWDGPIWPPLLADPEARAAVRLLDLGLPARAAQSAERRLSGPELPEVERVALGFVRALARIQAGLPPELGDLMRVFRQPELAGLQGHAGWHLGRLLWSQAARRGEAHALEVAGPYLEQVPFPGRYGLEARGLRLRGLVAAGRLGEALELAQESAAALERRRAEPQALALLAWVQERAGQEARRAGRTQEAAQALGAALGLWRQIGGLWPEHPAAGQAAAARARLEAARARPGPDPEGLERLLSFGRAAVARPHGPRDLVTLGRLRGLVPADLRAPGAAELELLWAEAAIRQRRFGQAAARLTKVRARAPERWQQARAALLLARLAARRSSAAGQRAYQEVADRFPDTPSAAQGLYRAAEIARRRGEADTARALFERCLDDHPADDAARACAWGLAWGELVDGELMCALERLEPLAAGDEPQDEAPPDEIEVALEELLEEEAGQDAGGPAGPEPPPAEGEPDELLAFDLGAASLRARARYWAARVRERLGEDEPARDAYLALAAELPFSYYGLLAWERLLAAGDPLAPALRHPAWPEDEGPLDPARPRLPAPSPGELEGEAAMAAAYHRLGLTREARASLAGVRPGDLVRPADARAAALVLASAGELRRAHRMPLLPRDGGLPGHPVDGEPPLELMLDARLAYPRAFAGPAELAAREAGVPASLVYAVMRIETGFWAEGRSPAGARGLMQVTPPTGQRVAARLRLRGYAAWRLVEVDTSLRVGAAFLGMLQARYRGNLPLVLGAYNAGEGAMERWLRRRPGLDLDAFLEEIPVAETALYIRRTLSYTAIYRMLDEPRATRPLGLDLGPVPAG